ncbi:MAG: hypothetical protein NTW58_00155 [Actinobacteria bacterium]|nr:hypothetical protein [Actinomycetota bacterium]
MRRESRTRRAVTGLAAALVLLAVVLPLAACGVKDDPFAGLWWEPTTGRRIEIIKEGEQYRLLYGAAQRAYQAAREGDELRIRQPFGGDIVVTIAADGSLKMISGGKSSRLERVPQHQ